MASPPRAVVIFLHGLGDSGSSFHGFRQMRLPVAPVRWHFPTAAQRPISLAGGMPMNAWFDLDDLPVTKNGRDDEEGFAASVRRVTAIIDAEVDAGVDPRNIYLGGFSQGGAMTLAAGLRYAAPLGGLVVCAGWLPMREKLDEWRSATSSRTPVFFAHGRHDDKVPFELGELARQSLADRGFTTTWVPFSGGHELPTKAMDGMRDFLTARMSDAPPS